MIHRDCFTGKATESIEFDVIGDKPHIFLANNHFFKKRIKGNNGKKKKER